MRTTVSKVVPGTRAQIEKIEKEAPEYAPPQKGKGKDLPRGGYELVQLSTVKPEWVEWLAPDRLAYGKLALLEGDPGVGKSTLTLKIAANLSQGDAPFMGDPPLKGGPAATIILTSEDGLADTVRPRVDAAFGNPALVHVFKAAYVNDGQEVRKEMPQLPRDISRLEDAIQKTGARLLIVDGITGFLDVKTNSYKDQDVRHALTPLAEMAERTSIVVIIIRHLTKNPTTPALYRGGGSIAFIGLVRIALLVAKDPDEPDADPAKFVLAIQKNNLARIAPSLEYTIEETDGGVSRISWGGTSEHTPSTLLAEPVKEKGSTKLTTAIEETLPAILRDGEVLAKEVFQRAREEWNIGERTLKEAKKKLGVVSRREGFGRNAQVYWGLPEKETAT